jgi:hypothetical protein
LELNRAVRARIRNTIVGTRRTCWFRGLVPLSFSFPFFSSPSLPPPPLSLYACVEFTLYINTRPVTRWLPVSRTGRCSLRGSSSLSAAARLKIMSLNYDESRFNYIKRIFYAATCDYLQLAALRGGGFTATTSAIKEAYIRLGSVAFRASVIITIYFKIN